KLIGGLRYEEETRDLENLATRASLNPVTGFTPPPGLNYATCTTPFQDGTGVGPNTCSSALVNRSASLHEVTGKLGLEYAIKPDVLLYASVSRGVKSGGFTAYNTLTPSQADPFRPEELWAYEAGAKTDLFDRRLRLNGAVYYYDYSDEQVQGAIFVGGF